MLLYLTCAVVASFEIQICSFLLNSQLSSWPRRRRVDKHGAVREEWIAAKNEFMAHMNAYFDASSPDALASLKDVDGEDSDYKWLEVVRGLRPGVARMGGIDRPHLKRQRERKRRKELRKLQKQKAEEDKKVGKNKQ